MLFDMMSKILNNETVEDEERKKKLEEFSKLGYNLVIVEKDGNRKTL